MRSGELREEGASGGHTGWCWAPLKVLPVGCSCLHLAACLACAGCVEGHCRGTRTAESGSGAWWSRGGEPWEKSHERPSGWSDGGRKGNWEDAPGEPQMGAPRPGGLPTPHLPLGSHLTVPCHFSEKSESCLAEWCKAQWEGPAEHQAGPGPHGSWVGAVPPGTAGGAGAVPSCL